MLKTIARPLTVDDYRELPAGPPYYQLIEGDIFMAPSKRMVYARSGVEELWLVDPDRRRVDVYRFAESADEPALTCSGRQRLTSRVFPGFQISLSEIFRR